jgi:hypothetical protein
MTRSMTFVTISSILRCVAAAEVWGAEAMTESEKSFDEVSGALLFEMVF